MAVISMLSTKGGAGKTTMTLVLAGELARMGQTVTVIDADPNAPLLDWIAQRKTTPFAIIEGKGATIEQTILAADSKSDFVLVDVEGVTEKTMTKVAALSNLVLTPLQPSAVDAREAAKVIAMVNDLGEQIGRDIKHTVVFTRIPTALTARIYRTISAHLQGAYIDVLPQRLCDREAYRAMMMYKKTLQELVQTQVSGLLAARENADAFMSGVVTALTLRPKETVLEVA